MTKQSIKRLFDELEAWSRKKESFSLKDFLEEKKLSFKEFEHLANSSKKFMKIWARAESQAWENIKYALFTKSQPRSNIAKCIEDKEVFQDRDPEEVMKSLESCQAKLYLYQKAISGDFSALIKCSLERGI